MEITIQYTGQLAGITGTSEESFGCSGEQSLLDLVKTLAAKHGPEYKELVLTEQSRIRPSLLVIINGEQAEGPFESLKLQESQTVMLMTPIAGG
ncbi:MAG: MoaD/ThiS family protein [Verrucomicrobiales bacterium]|nr:MoaD/ThiS family protein [Verrucomicrobiales bacterium]